MKRSCLIIGVLILFFGSCGKNPGLQNTLPDGYYTAETVHFDSHGWKEFLSVHINNGKIVSVEYNAKNSSGFIKSWDPEYMRRMNATDGTYPNEYTRAYATSLLDLQDPEKIDAISGATNSFYTFKLLAEAVLKQARAGAKQVAFVEAPRGIVEESPSSGLSRTP